MSKLFESKKIIFQGRAGLILNINKYESYFIDSEILNGKYDIVIYKDSIRQLSGSRELNKEYRNIIFRLLLHELKKLNTTYEVL